MTAELARVGGPLACLGLVLLYLAPRRDLRGLGLAAWALGCLFLALYLEPHGHRPALAVAAVLGLAAAAAGAAILLRRPWLVTLGALACAPARIPVHVGSTQANLLLPLYGVVAAAALALGWQLARGDQRVRELGALALPLAVFVGWTGLSLSWSDDLRQGAIELLFYVLPFALLAVAVARLAPSPRWLRVLYVQLALMALAFAAIGVYQWATRDIFWNPKVIVGNAYAPFYRVNSVFYDPSIYGRFLVCAIVASLVLVLARPAPRLALALVVGIAITWVGLLFSFSQSSFAALIVAVLAVAALAWRWRAAAVLGLVAAVLLSVGFSVPKVRSTLVRHSSAGLNKATSDRSSLVGNGVRIALHHPVIGVGVGGFKRAYADRLHLRGREPQSAASHNTPVTVAAETGLPGLALLVWLVVAALLATLGRGLGTASRIVGLVLIAIVVHSLFYNAFFEDPIVWVLFGLAALLLPTRRLS
ncbi:MAG: O-antigen ligase family protein [Gaiellaceae bacterium]